MPDLCDYSHKLEDPLPLDLKVMLMSERVLSGMAKSNPISKTPGMHLAFCDWIQLNPQLKSLRIDHGTHKQNAVGLVVNNGEEERAIHHHVEWLVHTDRG